MHKMHNMKNKDRLLTIGQFALALGILAYVFNYLVFEDHPVIAFISGILFGLSLVMNLNYMIQLVKRRKKKDGGD